MLGTNALFHADAVCNDGDIRMDGISILSESENNSNVGVWHFGIVVSANLQDSIRQNGVECGGCCGGFAVDSYVRNGMEKGCEGLCEISDSASR